MTVGARRVVGSWVIGTLDRGVQRLTATQTRSPPTSWATFKLGDKRADNQKNVGGAGMANQIQRFR